MRLLLTLSTGRAAPAGDQSSVWDRPDWARLAWLSLAAIGCLCAAAVFADTLLLTVRFFQPAFIDDPWETVKAFKAYRAGTFGLADLFAQHNEHRIAVPRLVFLADFVFGRGLNVVNIAAIYAIEALHAALLIAMAACVSRGAILALVSSAIVILLFSFGQSDNLTFGFQVQFVGVFAAATVAFLSFAAAAQPGATRSFRALAAIGALSAAAIATYMMSNGLLCPLILVALALVMRADKGLTFVTALFATALLFAYLRGAHFGLPVPAAWSRTEHLLKAGIHALVYVGGVSGSFGVATAAIVGAAGCASSVAAVLRLMSGPDRNVVRAALVAVMAFVIATAAVTGWGRVGLGLGQALDSRYMTPSSVFWAAQLITWSSYLRPSTRSVSHAVFVAAWAFLTAGAIERHVDQRPAAKWNFMDANLGSDALLSHVHSPDDLRKLGPRPDEIEQLAPFLADQKLNIFAWPEAEWFGKSLTDVFPGPEDRRCIVVLDRRNALDANDDVAVEGWAWDKRLRRPVSRILLVDSARRIVGFGSGGWFRPDFRDLPSVENAEPGWKGFAKASTDKTLTPYAVLDGGRTLCGASGIGR